MTRTLDPIRGLCKTCRHFLRIATEPDQGECRHSPPQVTIALIPSQDIAGRRGMAPQNLTAWPLVKDEQFCGEWAGHLTVAN